MLVLRTVVLLLFAALLAAVVPAFAQGQLGYEEVQAECKDGKCTLPEDQLVRIAIANSQMDRALQMATAILNAQTNELGKVRAELDRLKKSCAAKLEVVPDGTRKRS